MRRLPFVGMGIAISLGMCFSSNGQSEGVSHEVRASTGTILPTDLLQTISYGDIPDFVGGSWEFQRLWHPCISVGRTILFSAFSAELLPSELQGKAHLDGVWLSRPDGSFQHVESDVWDGAIGSGFSRFAGLAQNVLSIPNIEMFSFHSITDVSGLQPNNPDVTERFSSFIGVDQTVLQEAGDLTGQLGPADFNRDHVVNGADLATLLANLYITCP